MDESVMDGYSDCIVFIVRCFYLLQSTHKIALAYLCPQVSTFHFSSREVSVGPQQQHTNIVWKGKWIVMFVGQEPGSGLARVLTSSLPCKFINTSIADVSRVTSRFIGTLYTKLERAEHCSSPYQSLKWSGGSSPLSRKPPRCWDTYSG